MTKSPLSPLITTAKGYLDEAGARPRKGRRDQAVGYGLDLLAGLLGDIDADLARRELAELAVVYDTLAVQVVDMVDLQVPEAFVALVELCTDESARQLVKGQPPPTPTQLELLRTRLLWITVTYTSSPDGACQRSSEIVYKALGGELLSRKVVHDMTWDDLPAPARERLLAGSEHAVRYQLYPATDTDEKDQSWHH